MSRPGGWDELVSEARRTGDLGPPIARLDELLEMVLDNQRTEGIELSREEVAEVRRRVVAELVGKTAVDNGPS